MSNKIIDSLISGALAAKGSVSFDNTQVSYFVTYAGGAVGAYGAAQKLSFYNYSHFEQNDDGRIVQTAKSPRTFFLDKSLNDFFNSIINNNAKIAQALSEQQIASATELDRNFITGVYFYSPRAQVNLETVDMTRWTLKDAQKTAWAAAVAYQSSVSNRLKAVADQATLAQALATYIVEQVEAGQRAGSNEWTAGMLTFEIKDNLINQAVLLNEYTALTQEMASFNLPNPPTLNMVLTAAIALTNYQLARQVDLALSPYLYLYPRGANMPAPSPAQPS